MRIMKIIAALLACLAVSLASDVQLECQNRVRCPCGRTGKNVAVCVAEVTDTLVCTKLSNCEVCQEGLDVCSKCPEGFEGPLCSEGVVKSRQKRQFRRNFQIRRWQSETRTGPLQMSGPCPTIEGPKLGRIRCVTMGEDQTCMGSCLPGYHFVDQPEDEILLTCRGGFWEPFSSFPPCVSGGACELVVVQGSSGAFNCTTGIDGTRCDVRCFNRYVGQYFCFPGVDWAPPLPGCVRPKEIINVRPPMPSCLCDIGMFCDSNGRCVCPAGTTGANCESVLTESRTCRDPGNVSNGFRRNMDGSDSSSRRNFEEGQSVVYVCTSEEYVLRGSSLLTCRKDGTWSTSLPTCSKPVAPDPVCEDPGQVANAERLNSDGSPSVGVQKYRVGQSVVYTCKTGFALQRRSLITCLASGAWSFRTPYCKPDVPIINVTTPPGTTGIKFCRDPGVDPNGMRRGQTPRRRGFPQGTRLQYSCEQDYDLEGERTIFCLTSGEWSASRPRCIPTPAATDEPDVPDTYCVYLGPISNGQVVVLGNNNNRPPNEPEYIEGTRLRYSCNIGYVLVGQPILICELSGFWSEDPPVCNQDAMRYCEYPGDITNGRVVHVPFLNKRRRPTDRDDEMEQQFPAESRLQYTCNDGYTLNGPDTITCESSGRWSSAVPRCMSSVRPEDMHYCPNPEQILNGQMTYFPPGLTRRSGPRPSNTDLEEYPEGSMVQYSCEEGYILQGNRSMTCEKGGFWAGKEPRCVSDCGRTLVKASHRVFFGNRTNSGEWPWVVSISVLNNNRSSFICGGAILDTQTVITAGHCLNYGAEGYVMRFGKHHYKIQEDDSQVLVRRSRRISIHPDYNQTQTTLDSDIGLLTFEPKIKFTERVRSICLPTHESTIRNIMTGRTGYVSGWGETEHDMPSDIMLMTSLPVVPYEDCQKLYRPRNMVINGNMFCAGHEDARQNVCSGDSGSPLVFYDGASERYVLEGLVSFAPRGQCGRSGKYAIFTKVSRFVPWIEHEKLKIQKT